MIAACIDVGTSMIKTVAFDDDGRELLVARRRTTVLRPRPGFAEQDMEQVWRGVAETLAEVREQAREEIGLVALTAQGDGCWLVDEDGEPTGPGVLWNDGRNPAPIEAWERDGTIEQAFRINGSLPFPGLVNAILPWLREHEPERVRRAHKALYCGGWIFSRLTGELAVDESDASVPLLDIRAHQYSDELLALYDLEWARPLLPEIRRMDGRTGALGARAAEATGLPEGLPVIMAPFDVAATAIGCGAVEPGQACSILGTTLCTQVMLDHVDTDTEPTGFHLAMGIPDRWLRTFATLAGTDVLSWAMGVLGIEDVRELIDRAEQAPPGAGGIVSMPYLSPAGERAPFLNANARGMLYGLSLEHDSTHIARALLEGLTLVLRDCLRASKAEPSELRVCGGGAASDFWCQLIADVTGVPTLRTNDTEIGAKGAYITALVATGREPSAEAAVGRLVGVRDRCEPRAALVAHYDEQFEAFLEHRETAVDVVAAAGRHPRGGRPGAAPRGACLRLPRRSGSAWTSGRRGRGRSRCRRPARRWDAGPRRCAAAATARSTSRTPGAGGRRSRPPRVRRSPASRPERSAAWPAAARPARCCWPPRTAARSRRRSCTTTRARRPRRSRASTAAGRTGRSRRGRSRSCCGSPSVATPAT